MFLEKYSWIICILLFSAHFSCKSKHRANTKLEKNKFSESVLYKIVDKSNEYPPKNSIYKNAENPVVDRVLDLLSYMTLEEKVGQMTQVGRQFLKEEKDISDYFLGSLLSAGASPSPNTPKSWAKMYDSYQKIALSTRLKIPLIYGIDAIHGHNNVAGATIFPHQIGLGCTDNPKLIEDVFRATAIEVAATGIDWNFAPNLGVARDERWGRTYECFGETPEIVSKMAKASIKGLQSNNLGQTTSILACAKHFIGDGGTLWGTGLNEKIDQGDARLSEKQLNQIHLQGFLKAIDQGVGTIMPSYNMVNGKYSHGRKDLLTHLLKENLNFDGFLISDWRALEKIGSDYKENIIKSINAGVDMVMVPGAEKWGGEKYTTFISLLIESVKEGSINIGRINNAVAHILKIKFQMGLFEKPFSNKLLLEKVGSREHRNIARKAVRESMVLLKNDGILPLSKNLGHIHITGKNANDLGNQCGGWTISIQGNSGSLTTGTTVYEAIQLSVNSTTRITFSQDGSGAEGADVGIAVIGEKPYATSQGDTSSLMLDIEDINCIAEFYKMGIPVVVIIISGRPLIIEKELEKWNGLIAAWLPGSEGSGIADVIFGDYNPSGKLSISWPRSMDQIPINFGDKIYDPLFKYGFGLRYSKNYNLIK